MFALGMALGALFGGATLAFLIDILRRK